MKKVLIRDVNGDSLKLLKDRLVEVNPSSARRWTVTFANLLRALKSGDKMILLEARAEDQDEGIGRSTKGLPAEFDKKKRRVGCRILSRSGFRKLLKAAQRRTK